MDDQFFGYPVEILSLATGESQSVPMAAITLRVNPDECLAPVTLMLDQQQCVRLCNTLDDFVNDPESWLYVPAEEQMAYSDCDDDDPDLRDEIVPLLMRFAAIPEDSEESRRLRRQLTTMKMVLTAMLLFLADGEWTLFAACALARIDSDRAALVLPTLIAGLKSDSQVNRACAAVACRSLGQLASPAVPVLIEVLETENSQAVRQPIEEALARIGR